ncbi:MAG: hypothetical protein OEW08_14795, partial [Gammaproteobacteria bacterium]|nr:hypothetical protein [Gammaproteobacteria bacterium]
MLKSKRIVSFAYLLAFATAWVAMGCSKHEHPAAEQPQPPLVNRLAFSIDGGPEITYEGPSTPTQDATDRLNANIGLWTGDQTSNANASGVFLMA